MERRPLKSRLLLGVGNKTKGNNKEKKETSGEIELKNLRMKSPPPSLLSLAIDATISNIQNISSDLSFLPNHILIDLFLRTLKAGKLTPRILKIFVATGDEEIITMIQALNIQLVWTPVIPTRCSDKF